MDAETKALIDRLLARVDELEAENRALRARLEEAEAAAARQAAPFRRRDGRKLGPAERGRPGRPAGHPGTRRAIPGHVDDHVEVPLPACPSCGGPVDDVAPIVRYIEEVEPARPRVTRLVTHRGSCPRCGPVHSSHPLQTAPGPGGSAAQIGPRALAAAARLSKQHGLTMRTACAVLGDLAGLRLSPGGLAQALRRAAAKVEPEYQRLKAGLRGAAAVFADETSWWVGGPGWWLWTFTCDTATVYAVEPSRGAGVVTGLLGDGFAGMLVSDCLSSYDPPPYRKHKCIAHHQRAIAEARASPGGAGSGYLLRWRWLFTCVAALARARPAMGPRAFEEERARLESATDRLLAEPTSGRAEEAVRRRLEKQRAHLLGCLDEPAAEATNNRAERALRPAVVARKLSCGNKTESGKHCWEVLASLAATCRQNGEDFLDWLASKLAAAPTG
jgi:transposase